MDVFRLAAARILVRRMAGQGPRLISCGRYARDGIRCLIFEFKWVDHPPNGEVVLRCSRGKANPKQNTRIRLFADSGGYCQNPGCAHELFLDLDSGPIHVAEMAHIFAANDDGPRGNVVLSEAERGTYETLDHSAQTAIRS